MHYAIIATDVENSLEKRMAARPAHLERLHALKDAGRLLLALIQPLIATTRAPQVLPAVWWWLSLLP